MDTRMHLIPQMRERVADVNKDAFRCSDTYLARWIQYQHYDLDKAVTAFKAHLKWRTENDIDHILEEDFTDLDSRFPVAFDPADKHGRPVIRFMWEDWNTKDMKFDDQENERYKRASFQLAERIEEFLKKHSLSDSKKGNGEFTRCVYVMDCTKMSDHIKDIGVRNIYAVLRLAKDIVGKLGTNYPRTAAACYVLNASKWFTFFFTAIKPFVSKDTQKVLEIHGPGSSKTDEWKSLIYDDIALTQCTNTEKQSS